MVPTKLNDNQWGNYADAFTPGTSKPAAKQGTNKLINSNTNGVTLGKNQGGQSVTAGTDLTNLSDKTMQTLYLNQLLNNFSWWQPQRLAMGTKLNQDQNIKDNIKYQPTVKEIDTNTQHKLADFTVKDGIENIQGPDGIIAGALDNDKTVDWTKTHWYNASTDGKEFNDQYKNYPLVQPKSVPTSSNGNLEVTGTTPAYQTAAVVYADGSIDFVDIPFVVTNKTDTETYTPSYKPVNIEQGQTATVDPSFTTQDDKAATAPTGTTFTTGTDTPDWATIDPSTGTVTVKPGTDVTPGAYNVPVTVTYPDKSTDETTVPVIVTKAGQTVTWGDNGAVVTTVDTSKLNAHETTENSQVLSAAGVVTAEGYELTDGKLSTTATPITIDPAAVSWTTSPDTNVDTATAAGKEITTSVNVDFTNNDAAKNILGSKNGTVTTNPFTIDAKGAGAKNVTTPVNVDLGSDLTSEQFSQLVDNNIPTDEIASTTWATKPDAKGQGGVIKITFTDKDANGNPTYLNVNVPASSLKVTTDADDHTPEGQDVSTKVGEAPDAEKGIKNPGSLPSGTTYTWQDTPDTTKPGKKPAVVVVTYPDGSKDTVPTNVIVNAKPEIKTITTTVGGDPAATQGIANLNNGGTSPVDCYPSSATWTTKPDTSKPGATTGTAVVTYPDGTTETVTIPVAVNGQGDVTVIDNGHVFSLHANNVVTHKTSDKNIIGGPVIENFKLSYYQGGQNYSKPYIYTLNADKTAYELTQTGDNPSGVTVNAPQSINASDIKISWTEANTVLFNNALGAIKGNGQPTSLASENNGGTKTITYTNWVNNQFGYPKYSAVVNSSNVIWPIYGKGPVSTYPFPSVYIYGAEANDTIPSVNSDVTDLKAALGDASKLVNTSDLTAAHNAKISSVDWQKLPSRDKADAKAPATVRINFTDGSYLDVPVAVNVIKVDQGVDDKTNHDLYRDITRTITVQGESAPVVQHVIYSRAKITDLSKPADQQVTYTDWAPAKNSEGQVVTNFPQYEVTKPGYTATATGATIETIGGKQYVPASKTITPDSANEVVNVTYAANEHTLVINYVDGNGNVVGTYNVPGKTDETVNVDVPGNVPANWKLVPNQQVIGSYKFGSDDPQPITYKVEHGTEVVPVDKNNKNTYRKITQTIQEVPAGKTNADMTLVRTASVEFERTGVKDLVTGETTWNAWNSNSETFPAYNIKEQKGYDSYVNDVKATEVAAVTVNPDSSDITATITYVKQDATPVPYDPTRDDMSVTRTINYEVPAGHEAIAPVTQTVEYTRDVNGVAGYQDPVTGDITWNPWHVKSGKAEFASVSVEQIKGYDSYVDSTKSTEVAAAQVTEKDGVPQNGAAVNVTYTANEHTLVIKYVDGNGNVVGTYNVPGKTGEKVTVDVPGHVLANWKLVPNQKVIGSYKFGSDDPRPVTYKVEHGTEVVPVDKNNKDTYREVTQTIYEVPAGKTDADKKVAKTTIVPFQRTGVKDLVTGEITWNAWQGPEGTVDKDGVPTYTIPAYTITPQKGYDTYVNGVKNTANQIPAVDVTADSANITDTITYVKQDATPVPYDPSNKDMNMPVTRTINYEVPAGHEAIAPVTQTVEYTRDVNGVAGYQDPVTDDITWNPWHVKSGNGEFASANVEQIKGYDSYVNGKKSTEVPAAQVIEKDGVPQNGANVTVSYPKQGDTPVPYKPGQDGINDDMNQYVTRTIVVHEPGKDPVSHNQTVHFTREDANGNAGYTDPVTGETTWNHGT
ncbi:Rib/alpha-like domain-containing protein [Limosilactobacillus reuteri]|uniref:Rib/alpha-like domain-containing protein n=1 Tax=Limosilactobacillus reuteri TaxID=1598 RepID=UPI001CDC6FA7|nr:Rib/alpha-like domain-containing protein [Limosilactobacillus reuteri]